MDLIKLNHKVPYYKSKDVICFLLLLFFFLVVGGGVTLSAKRAKQNPKQNHFLIDVNEIIPQGFIPQKKDSDSFERLFITFV